MTDFVRIFEGTHVPATFESLLTPNGEDPDGLGPRNYRDRILLKQFAQACQGSPELFKPLSRQLFEHQKYQLKNSHVIADEKGDRRRLAGRCLEPVHARRSSKRAGRKPAARQLRFSRQLGAAATAAAAAG